MKPKQAPAAAESEKWLRARFLANFWLRIRTKNAGSLSTSDVDISGTLNLSYCFRQFNNSSQWISFGRCFPSLARNTLICTFRYSQVNASEPTVDPPLSWLFWKTENNLHVKITLLTKLWSSRYKLAY